MKEFLLIIRGGDDVIATKSAGEIEVHMQKWQDWIQEVTEKGHYIDGQPLHTEGMTLIDGGTKVIDRPLVEGKEMVGGYLMFKATNLEEAVALAKDCPGFEYGTTIEVRPIAKMD